MKPIIEPQTKRVIDTFLSENYQVQQYRSDFCFQFMALKHINLLIKMSYNIDAIRQYILNQLRLISKLLPSLPLIIGEKNKTASLEDDNIYLRGNIFAMNFNTFRKILSESAFSYIYAQRGRYVVEIDGDKLREIREQNNMKTSDLAGLVGVSAKAIEQYEKNQTNVKLEVMEKMENIFRTDLRKKVEIMGDMVGKLAGITVSLGEITELSKMMPDDKKLDKNVENMVKHISEVMEDVGYQMLNLYNSPFDVLMYDSNPQNANNTFFHFPGKVVPDGKIGETQLQESAHFIKAHLQTGAMILDESIDNDNLGYNC